MLNEPSVLLTDIDMIYGTNEMAVYILRDQFIALYKLSTAKEEFSNETARNVAGIFFGTYGNRCTLNQMMLYFGKYPVAYKTTFSQFDSSDILRQYGAKFIPWFQSQTTEDEQEQPVQTRTAEPRGIEARNIYLREQIRKGADVRQGGLYRFGFVTEDELQQLEREVYS